MGSIISATAFALSYYASSVEYLYLVYGILGGMLACEITSACERLLGLKSTLATIASHKSAIRADWCLSYHIPHLQSFGSWTSWFLQNLSTYLEVCFVCKHAYSPPNGKRLPSPVDICNTRSIADAFYAKLFSRLQHFNPFNLFTGIGLCMIYLPAVLTVGFYFEKWRALATGLALCGSGFGTFAMGPLTSTLLENLGSWRLTILVHAGLCSTKF